ncbi:MAG: glycosyltransferase family 4 protein [Alphaproteobacteria bacterium]
MKGNRLPAVLPVAAGRETLPTNDQQDRTRRESGETRETGVTLEYQDQHETAVAPTQGTAAPGKSSAARGALNICLLSYRSLRYCGGQGVYLKYLSKSLVEAGHRVDVISGPPYPDLVDGVRLIKLPSLDMYGTGKRWSALGWRDLRSLTNIIEWLGILSGGFPEPYTFGRRAKAYLARHKDRYDVVHDNQTLCYSLLDMRRWGLPLISTIHHPITVDLSIHLASARNGFYRLLIRRWHSFLRMQRKVAPRLDHILTISRASKAAIERDFGVRPAAMDIVYNGIDAQNFAPRPDIPRRANRLMAMASADAPMKGLDILLRAFAALHRDRPDLELVVIGKPQEGGRTERLIRKLGLSEPELRFQRDVPHDRLVELYAEATVAIVPSIYEGFSLPAGEAMACGVPLVATTGGALPEVVGEAGVLVPPGDVDALRDAVSGLLDDPDRRRELGEAGRRRVLEQFSWKRVAAETVAIYEKALISANR